MISLGAIFAQRFADDLLKLSGRVCDVTRERRWLFLKNRRHHLAWCVAGEWHMPGYHFVKNYAETPDIGAFINVPAARLLGRHVTNGSQYRAEIGLNQQQCFVSRRRYRHFLLGKLCNPKVEHFHVSVRPEHDVLRLDVAMDNAFIVRSGDRTRYLDRDVNSFTQLHRPAREKLAQCVAVDQFTGYVMS